MNITADKVPTYLLILAAITHCSGLFVPIIGTDGTLYAVVAKTMAENHNFSDLYVHGKDWLDKPHFPFWVTAISFKLFGVNTFAYKFPALIFTAIGAWCTFKLAEKLYDRRVAMLSVLILLTAEHLILSNNDVRAEPYLTALVIGAVYYFYEAYHTRRFSFLVLGSLFAACAVMTKGIFVLIIIGAAIAGGIAMKREWRELFNVRWLLAFFLIIVFITPELYSLYVQFDLHPEKVVFGTTGVSGLQFFFWDSQFGRFMNTGPIRGSGDPFFFLHTLLWAYLPWCIFFYAGVIRMLASLNGNYRRYEWFCMSGSLVGLLLFSLSSFQLPHYANILFPFFSVITAHYLLSNSFASRAGRASLHFQNLVSVLLFVLPFAMVVWVWPAEFPIGGLMIMVPLLVILIILAIKVASYVELERVMYRTMLACLAFNLFLNLIFYPFLLKYQSGSEAAFWVNEHYPKAILAHSSEGAEAYAFEFYARQPVPVLDSLQQRTPVIVYAAAEKVAGLRQMGYEVQSLKSFAHFHISKPNATFLNGRSRREVLKEYQLVLLERRKNY